MATLTSAEKLISSTSRKKLGSASYYGERIFGEAYFGKEYSEVSPYQYGKREYAEAKFGENLTYEGIFQKLNKKTGDVYARLNFYFPKYSRNELQDISRINFANGVLAWQSLTASQKEVFRVKSFGRRMTGFNLFLHEYLISN